MMGTNRGLWDLSPESFVRFLGERGIGRFSFIFDRDRERLISSHEELEPLADLILELPDFDRHEGLFFQVSRPHGVLQGVFVHKTARGQAAGGIRFRHYDTVGDYFVDGVRLSRAMTLKIALAGLWWGGGKGVMAKGVGVDNDDRETRAAIYASFGELCSRIRGCYVAAEDVGTTVSDMESVFSRTRFTTCIPPYLGGSGNPSILTAKGVLCGMEAALEFTGAGPMADITVAVQGVGNVGGALVRFLLEKGVKKVVAVDTDPSRVEAIAELRDERIEARRVEPGDLSILAAHCDILSPNATGGIINRSTISRMRASIICGGANNQLEDPIGDDMLLYQRGIVYLPDFLVNRMGIVNCANEQYGLLDHDPYIERHLGKEWEHSIHNTVLEMLSRSRNEGAPPGRIALDMAERLSNEPHPIFAHRGRDIIDNLARERWHQKERL